MAITVTKANACTNGSSFFETTIRTTPNALIALAKRVGADYHEHNDGMDKTNFDFTFESKHGVFTVYDWKKYRSLELDKHIDFHIGGFSKAVTEQSKDALMDNDCF